MKIKKLAIGLLGAALVYDGIIARRNREMYTALKTDAARYQEVLIYFAHKLKEHKIPYTEFDNIVMSYYSK